MIKPFHPKQIREVECLESFSMVPAISKGVSSFGYDFPLSDKEFKICFNTAGAIIDPKSSSTAHLAPVESIHDEKGEYFILPGRTWGLGVLSPLLRVPDDVLVIFLGKSTLARHGILLNVTPAEPGWQGHLTVEITNSGPNPCRIYANEGICQGVFLKGDRPAVTYGDRKGKYQDQQHEITHARL